MTEKTYILAFGAHPDDVEVGAGGVLYTSAKAGKKNVIIDLTPSQLSTHGDVATRQEEAQHAASLLGVHERINLGFQDGEIFDTKENREKIATYIRRYTPEVVLLPWIKDRHPDHEATAALIKNAVFYAGLQKLDLDGLPIHKPRLLVHYMIWEEFEPDVIIPLTQEQFDTKMGAFCSYVSQQETNGRGCEYIQARHIVHGHRIGAKYGEGFKLYSHAVGVQHFDDIQSGFF